MSEETKVAKLREEYIAPSTLETIDEAVYNWVTKDLNVFCTTEDGWKQVPVIWEGSERAYQIKHEKNLRDDNNILVFPAIVVSRTGLSKKHNFKGSAWATLVPNKDEKGGVIVTSRRINQDKTGNFANAKYKRIGPYALRKKPSTKIVYETSSIPVPIYLELDYKIKIFTNYQEQINEISQVFQTVGHNGKYFAVTADNGRRYEAWLEDDFTPESDGKLGENERRFQATVSIKVLGYTINAGDNSERPKIVHRENAVEFKIPREYTMLDDKPVRKNVNYWTGSTSTPTSPTFGTTGLVNGILENYSPQTRDDGGYAVVSAVDSAIQVTINAPCTLGTRGRCRIWDVSAGVYLDNGGVEWYRIGSFVNVPSTAGIQAGDIIFSENPTFTSYDKAAAFLTAVGSAFPDEARVVNLTTKSTIMTLIWDSNSGLIVTVGQVYFDRITDPGHAVIASVINSTSVTITEPLYTREYDFEGVFEVGSSVTITINGISITRVCAVAETSSVVATAFLSLLQAAFPTHTFSINVDKISHSFATKFTTVITSNLTTISTARMVNQIMSTPQSLGTSGTSNLCLWDLSAGTKIGSSQSWSRIGNVVTMSDTTGLVAGDLLLVDGSELTIGATGNIVPDATVAVWFDGTDGLYMAGTPGDRLSSKVTLKFLNKYRFVSLGTVVFGQDPFAILNDRIMIGWVGPACHSSCGIARSGLLGDRIFSSQNPNSRGEATIGDSGGGSTSFGIQNSIGAKRVYRRISTVLDQYDSSCYALNATYAGINTTVANSVRTSDSYPYLEANRFARFGRIELSLNM